MTPDPTASPAHPVETLSLAERLGRVAYRNQGRSEAEPHIVVDTAICNSVCPHKCTTYVCPANCYTLDEMQQVHFQFEDCIECGTCLYACDQGAVAWSYPDPEAGRGVNWQRG
ncbi:MAG: 4Fe-4S ferredoxin [Rhodothermaceae bacterium]|nr:4Fe-4S ferredoxin [Rhodothermaceae bacterium]